MILKMLVTLLGAALLTAGAAHAQPEPAFTYDSMLATYFDDSSGLIRFGEYTLAFMPEGELNAQVAVVDSENTVIKSFPFFKEYRYTEGIFGKAMVVGPAEVTLTEPGVYNIVFLIDGKPTSRLPVVLEQTSAGDDPFNPVKEFQFFGMWQVYGFLTMQEWKDDPYPMLNLWLGGRDLPENKDKDMFKATLRRDGEILGHSKETQGSFADGHYKITTTKIYLPHDRQGSPNALLLPLDEWTADGSYTLDINRVSDDQLIRRFQFTASDGKIQELPNAALEFEPHIDYLVPRTTKRGSGQYDFDEAIWLKSE